MMKAKIIIEQFSNGISLKWEGENHEQEAIVALDYDREKATGKMIWDDVKHIMDAELIKRLRYEKNSLQIGITDHCKRSVYILSLMGRYSQHTAP